MDRMIVLLLVVNVAFVVLDLVLMLSLGSWWHGIALVVNSMAAALCVHSLRHTA